LSSQLPIGLFDSGFGGLTVMKEVIRLLPQENLIYLGDTANLPYGNKSPEVVRELAFKNADFLMGKGIKMLMIPCHTACSHALSLLQQKLSIPVIGVIGPGLSLVKGYQRVAVLGTSSTIESGVYQSEILRQNPQIVLHAISCPLFVPLIEEGFHNHMAASLVAESYVATLREKVDAALLACTHYPLLKTVLQRAFGEKVALLEPAAECAKQAKEILTRMDLLNQGQATYQFFASDDPEKFRCLGKSFLGREIESVAKK
jgi:glutamate racemase